MEAGWPTIQGDILSSSGSGAQEVPWHSHYEENEGAFTEGGPDSSENVFTPEDEESFAVYDTSTFGAGDLRPGELMNSKIPPAFDGRGSWFAYEELV